MNDRDRDREDPPHVQPPAINPTDGRVRRLRDKAMDLLADARIHVQRLEEIGEHLGLTPDLVEGMGDDLYRAVVAQMDFAAKVFERTQIAAEHFIGSTSGGRTIERASTSPSATRRVARDAWS